MNNKNFIKKIEIKDGIISFNNVVEFYKQYLETPKPDWQNVVRRPVRPNIFKAMCAIHAKYGQDPLLIINSTLENGGKIYFWSDLHLFHENIIRFTSRPFETVDHMNQTLINNYWSIVTDKDLVIFGGDVGFGEVNNVRNLIQALPGKKILVLGNHDFDKNKCLFRNYHCFDITTIAFVFDKEYDGKKYHVIVSHYPIAADILPKNTINIHGHIHQYLPGEKNINMSVEHTAFAPVEMDYRIEELIKKLKIQGDFK